MTLLQNFFFAGITLFIKNHLGAGMKQNVSKIDRAIRLLIGLSIIVSGLISPSYWGIAGIYPVLTAVLGWCPLYLPFKSADPNTEKLIL